jgi:hypothetical protein
MLAESFTQRGAPELNVAFDHFIRQTDWRATELGSMRSWDPHLKAGVEMLAGLATPALLLCGDSNIVIHNDLCAPWLGGEVADTGGCGRKLADAWPLLADIADEAIACAQGGKASGVRANGLRAGQGDVGAPSRSVGKMANQMAKPMASLMASPLPCL